MDVTLSFGWSFLAGLLSFLSPCVLPLIPSYITFITGLSLEDATRARRVALVHSLLFVLGFTLIFLVLGATASVLGRLLGHYREWITRVGGAIIVVFGLYLLGVFQIGALSRERRLHIANKPIGYLGTVFVGMAFGAGWTPCLGPILSSILAITASDADFGRGMMYLTVYSLGLAIPFIAAAVALQRFLDFFVRMRTKMIWVTRISGVLLIVIGVLLMTNYFMVLATYLQTLTPAFLRF